MIDLSTFFLMITTWYNQSINSPYLPFYITFIFCFYAAILLLEKMNFVKILNSISDWLDTEVVRKGKIRVFKYFFPCVVLYRMFILHHDYLGYY